MHKESRCTQVILSWLKTLASFIIVTILLFFIAANPQIIAVLCNYTKIRRLNIIGIISLCTVVSVIILMKYLNNTKEPVRRTKEDSCCYIEDVNSESKRLTEDRLNCGKKFVIDIIIATEIVSVALVTRLIIEGLLEWYKTTSTYQPIMLVYTIAVILIMAALVLIELAILVTNFELFNKPVGKTYLGIKEEFSSYREELDTNKNQVKYSINDKEYYSSDYTIAYDVTEDTERYIIRDQIKVLGPLFKHVNTIHLRNSDKAKSN